MTTLNEILGVATPVPMGEWNATTPYQKLNIVRYKGASYMAKKQSTNFEPTVTTGWQEVWQLVSLDGRGVILTEITYQVGTSNMQMPTGNWVAAIPEVPQGQYLWTKSVYTYTDGTTTISYSVAYQGVDGNSIVSAVIEYQVGVSGTTLPTGNWLSNIPNVPQGQYLWTKTTINFSKTDSVSSYSAAYQGVDGRAIIDSIITYQASLSGTEIPNGEWGNEIPSIPQGQYLWTRTELKFSDNTSSFSYSVSLQGLNFTQQDREDIDHIIEVIPSSATANNQLADKAFVNSTVNNMSAFYITYTQGSATEMGQAFPTQASLLNATTFYSGTQVRIPTQNDYATVLADETQPKGANGSYPTTRYVYQTNEVGGTYPNGQWAFQYVVNNTSLTQAQVDAINSGVTKEIVEQAVNTATTANNAYSQANSAYESANNAYSQANLAYNQANLAYTQANNSITSASIRISTENPLQVVFEDSKGEQSRATIDAVPTSRTINGQPLTSDITIETGGGSSDPATPTTLGTVYGNTNSTSVALGYNANSYRTAAIAIGSNSSAQGYFSIAIGYNAYSQLNTSGGIMRGTNAIAIGHNAHTEGENSIALGYRTHTGNTGAGAIAIGLSATALRGTSIAIGYNTQANGSDSIAVGNNALALGYNAIAIGSVNVNAYGNHSIAIGGALTRATNYSLAIGSAASAQYNHSSVIGFGASAPSANTIVLGNANITGLYCARTSITALSDERTKEEITAANIAQCLVDVERLPVKRFKFKKFARYDPIDKHRTGWIAQDVEKVFPKDVQVSAESFPVLDENGIPVMIDEVDEDGNLVYEQIGEKEDGTPIYADKPNQVEKRFTIEDCKHISMEDGLATLWGAVQCLSAELKKVKEFVNYKEEMREDRK